MKQIIMLYKEDRLLLFLALFYSIIFSITVSLFSLIMSINFKTFILFVLILFGMFSKFLTNLREEKLLKKTIWFTLYFTLAPILSYITITMPLYVSNKDLLGNVIIMSGFYFTCMIIPYLFFITLIFVNKYRLLINKNIKVIKVSLSFMIAMITISFTLMPLIATKIYMDTLYVVTLLPFSLNILLICFIEYFQIQNEASNDGV